MNKDRRNKVSDAISSLSNAWNILNKVRDDEQSAFDNCPESLQNSEKGAVMEDWIGALSDSLDVIDTVIDDLRIRL